MSPLKQLSIHGTIRPQISFHKFISIFKLESLTAKISCAWCSLILCWSFTLALASILLFILRIFPLVLAGILFSRLRHFFYYNMQTNILRLAQKLNPPNDSLLRYTYHNIINSGKRIKENFTEEKRTLIKKVSHNFFFFSRSPYKSCNTLDFLKKNRPI